MKKQAQENSIMNFIPLQKIGQGTYSSVYKVRRIADNQIYALKKIKMCSLRQKQKKNALTQIRVLASLKCNNLIGYKQSFFDEKLNLLCVVMQYANEGDLKNKIKTYRQHNQHIPQPEIWKALFHIIQGLRKLHSNNILHRDIKSANILISNGIYKLGDFNVAKIKTQDEGLAYTQTGTPYYSSPQIWNDQAYGQKSDIWSFGCLAYQMCCWSTPFRGNSLEQLYNNITKGSYQEIPNFYSKQLRKIIASCLHKNPKKRPDTFKLLSQENILFQKCSQLGIQFDHQNQFLVLDNNFKKNIGNSGIMGTIYLPQNLRQLKNKLPKPNYSGRNNQSLFQKQLQQQVSIQIQKKPFVHKKYSNLSHRNFKKDHKISQKLTINQKIQQCESQKCIFINPKKSYSFIESARQQKHTLVRDIRNENFIQDQIQNNDEQTKKTALQQQRQYKIIKKRTALLQIGKRKCSDIKQRNLSKERNRQYIYSESVNRIISMKNFDIRQKVKQKRSFLQKQNGLCNSKVNQQLQLLKQNSKQKNNERQRMFGFKNRYFQQAISNKRSLLSKSKPKTELRHIQSVSQQKKFAEYIYISKRVQQVRNKVQDQFKVKKTNSSPYMPNLISLKNLKLN